MDLLQTQRVGSLMGGALRLIDGRGFAADGTLEFSAFAVISYSPRSQKYSFRSYAQGYEGDYPLEARPDGFIWTIKAGPATIRYIATIKENVGRDRRAHCRGPSRPVRIFEMALQRNRQHAGRRKGGLAARPGARRAKVRSARLAARDSSEPTQRRADRQRRRAQGHPVRRHRRPSPGAGWHDLERWERRQRRPRGRLPTIAGCPRPFEAVRPGPRAAGPLGGHATPELQGEGCRCCASSGVFNARRSHFQQVEAATARRLAGWALSIVREAAGHRRHRTRRRMDTTVDPPAPGARARRARH